MQDLLDILKYTLPSGIVFATAYFMLDRFFKEKQATKLIELQMANRKQVLPTRLQAYERLLLLLERIEPNNLIIRVHRPGMTSGQLQSELLQTVRQEYEHNLSQQLYVSSAGWKKVKEAKEGVVQLIGLAAEKVGPNASGADLGGYIFEIIQRSGRYPTHEANEALKAEARSLF